MIIFHYANNFKQLKKTQGSDLKNLKHNNQVENVTFNGNE